ncbi:response regulator transcription factor [Marinoscillum pacificum]|uniref:response regulator transcription factor n=1 Tax=Marinoscillum pacificum TaxID=392723 RepID=UPI00215860C0|nr:DNA-binding response regulator [Marinoscillum pacificum]
MKEVILIVEDDFGIRETVTDLIHTLGYLTMEAQNGEEALQLINLKKPHLIISDIMMPRMDGIELLSRLKSDKSFCTIPIIMLTAKADFETQLNTFRIGADGYVKKPFDLRELAYKIRNLINLRNNLLRSQVDVEQSHDPEWEFILKLNQFLEVHIHDISLEGIALLMKMSTSGLQKKLKKYSSQSFQDYVRIFKLSKAKSHLESGDCNVSEAAEKAGFKSLSSFSKSFKEQFGYSPKEMII